MPVTTTILFDYPQKEIASTIIDCLARCSLARIVTGFATPSGLEAIEEPIRLRPDVLDTLVIGAANYRAFEVLDDLIASGVSTSKMHIHLGHSVATGWPKKPFAQFHPMLHSKVYYFEFPNLKVTAFIGSHNLTHFALEGLNGEASIRLDGAQSDAEFAQIRNHIDAARKQAVRYSSTLKEAYAWWFREYFDGLKAEAALPGDWQSVRTILIFAEEEPGTRPKATEHLYFEIPVGIEQVTALQTEVHLFIFNTLPSDSSEALAKASRAIARYKCRIEGAENRQGNREVVANWQIEPISRPKLKRIASGIHRPALRGEMQQVRAEFEGSNLANYDYRFERERFDWDAELSLTEEVTPKRETRTLPLLDRKDHKKLVPESLYADHKGAKRPTTRRDGEEFATSWRLVKGFSRRSDVVFERDQEALSLARPEAGAFVMVSLQRRKRSSTGNGDED